MKKEIGIVPGLAVILVGDRKDSATYVRNKKKACESVGINSYEVCLPQDKEEVVKHISSFNDDPAVHGILVQLPLPSVLVALIVANVLVVVYDIEAKAVEAMFVLVESLWKVVAAEALIKFVDSDLTNVAAEIEVVYAAAAIIVPH